MALVTEEELLAATQFSQRGKLESALRRQHVRYFRGKGGCIWTTESALNHALNLIAEAQDKADAAIEFED